MAIPFLSYFKKKAKAEPVVETPAPMPAKTAGERMSKTVMPNASRTVTPAPEAAPSYAQTGSTPAPRTVSFGGAAQSRSADLPPAVALALEPNVERTITLDLADVVRHIPAGYVRELENGDSERRVLLKASELERGMANGKPTVSISSIYEQVPEIFIRSVSATNSEQVALPFSSVLEQFSNLQTRSDQQRPTAIRQVETPFLKVTQEDGERFGTPVEMREIADLPTVRVNPATAQSLADAEPEPAARFAPAPAAPAAKPFSLRSAAPTAPATNGNPGTAAPAAAPAPARIPFKLTPNGTGGSAPERVPASASGPSVPTSLPTVPTRIPFKVSAPSDDIRPKPEPWLTKASFEAGAATGFATEAAPVSTPSAPSGAPTIKLPLKAILEILPPMQLIGDLDTLVTGATVEFPFSLVEPQLVTGRVLIAPDKFGAALPAEYRGLFDATATGAPVSLPLQEVLKNLPATSLRMRDDQEEQEKGANFETPFSTKAAEDAKRMKVAATPVAKPLIPAEPTAPVLSVLPPPVAAPVEAAAPIEPAPAASAAKAPLKLSRPGERSALQAAFDTDDELDAKTVVAHIGKLQGVQACAIMFGDGLSLAGNLPDGYDADGLCAMAPSLLQRIENHMVETQLGALRAMTLSCAKAAITFFMHDNLCLAALHAKEELAVETRDRLGLTVQELSRQYSHPA